MEILKLFSTIGLLLALVSGIPFPDSNNGLAPTNMSLPHTPTFNTSTSPPVLTPSNLTTTLGDDPSFDHYPYSTIQAWMGKSKVTVGSMVGYDLFVTSYRLLDKNCPASMKWGICDHIPNAEFQSRCMMEWPAKTTTRITGIWQIKAKWSTEAIRKSLIGATAGMLQAATENEALGPTNGFDMAGTKGCNVGDVVRVNFPPSPNGEPNFIHIWLHNGKTAYGAYDCCSQKADVRTHMDVVMDLMKPEISAEFPEHNGDAWYRDSRCIVNEWDVC